MKYEFRKLKASDYPKIEQLIYETWDYKKYCLKEKTARYMAKIFLYQCLVEGTFSKAAVLEEEVVGVIIGKCKKRKEENQLSMQRKKRKIYLKLFWNLFLFSLSNDGRKNKELGDFIAQVDKKLYQRCQKSFDGELIFFVVDKKTRGLGIGKQLLDYLKDYMKYQKATDFFVFTDTTCNYQFYDRQGFKRLAKESVTLQSSNGTFEEDFFLYQYEFLTAKRQDISYYFVDYIKGEEEIW